MEVSLDKFWIKGILTNVYPKFLKDKGADLDGNGVVEGKEVFKDLNGDRVIGDEDYIEYLRINRSTLTRKIPFFKWGKRLSAANRIHQLFYLMSDIHSDTQIQSTYAFIANLVAKTNKRIEQVELPDKEECQLYYSRKLSAQKESKVYYEVIKGAGILFKDQKSPSLITNIKKENRKLDCDTLSFVVMAIGDEMGFKLNPVRAPYHVFLRGKDEHGKNFNVDQGEIKSDEHYRKRFKISADSIAKGVYLRTLDDIGVRIEFLENRGEILLRQRKYKDALAAFRKVIKIDPNNYVAHFNIGIISGKQGKYKEAMDAYDKVIAVNPKLAAAHNNRGLELERLGRYRQALKSLQKAYRLSSKTSWRFGSHLAWLYLRSLFSKK